jgi:phosphoribosylamine---glycine ligase
MKTRYNFVSETGDGVGFAIRLAQEDHDVRVWIRDSAAKSAGDGLVTKVGDLEDLIKDADAKKDVFIFDSTGNGVVADDLRSKGFGVIGDSILADRLERDRDFGLEVMEQAKVEVPKSTKFTDFDKAIDFVNKHSDTRFVYKPSKQLGDLSASHVAHDSEELIELLEATKKDVDIQDPEFVLQEFVEGIALSTELWFQNGELIEPLTNHTLERKEAMNGNLGETGGCSGNTVWICEDEECSVCLEVSKLVPFFKREGYNGMVDLNCLVAKDGTYGLEFTPRFGFDATPTFLWETVNEDLGKFLADAARGQLAKLDLDEGYGSGLRVSISPWPNEKYHAEENIPIRGLKADAPHTYFYNVKESPKGLCTSGAWGIICLFTGRGALVADSFKNPMEQAEKLRLKGKQYRTDLVQSFNEDLAKLNSLLAEVK